LAALDHGLSRKKRYGDIEADIDRHGPEQGMGDRIKAGKPEQRIWAEQCKPPRAIVQEALRDPSRSRERG
jgi:hypothetical protein